jgi:AraC-like DNA-binding protein
MMIAAPRCPKVARWSGGGVLMYRMDDEDGLYCGMKDLHAFLVVERGRSEVLHRGRTFPVGPGDIVLAQPGELYRDLRRDGPSTFDIVLFEPAHIADAARAAAGQPGEVVYSSPVLAPGDPRARPLVALCAALSEPASRLAREVAISEASAVLVEIATNRARARARERSAITRAVAYLRERVTERVRLDDLADHVRLDKHHLIRAFRAEIGVPPYEYLTHLRMVRARELLRGGMSSVRVAAALGYFDQSQLHRHFVRIVGTTPGAFATGERGWRANAT